MFDYTVSYSLWHLLHEEKYELLTKNMTSNDTQFEYKHCKSSCWQASVIELYVTFSMKEPH